MEKELSIDPDLLDWAVLGKHKVVPSSSEVKARIRSERGDVGIDPLRGAVTAPGGVVVDFVIAPRDMHVNASTAGSGIRRLPPK